MRRFSVIAAALAVATLAGCDPATPLEPAALTAAPAFNSGSRPVITRTNLRREVAFLSSSPCTMEQVQVTGRFHITVTNTVTNDEVSYRAHQNSQGMSGVGVDSGRRYRLVYISKDKGAQETSLVPTENGYEAQFSTLWKMVSQGSAPNHYITIKFGVVYDPDNPERSGFTHNVWESGCRG